MGKKKQSIQREGTPMIFNVTEYEKVIAVGSDSIFYSLLRSILLSGFCIVLKKMIHKYLKMLLKYSSLRGCLGGSVG